MLWRLYKKGHVFLQHIAIFILLIGWGFISYEYNITCLIKFFWGFRCPTCGMTRAIVCLLNGDFKGYIYYNIFAVPVLFAIQIIIHKKLFHRLLVYFSVVILFCNVGYYCYRIMFI